MCGIVGYIGGEGVSKEGGISIVVEGLQKLEYRGYDSAGIAYFSEGSLKVVRAVGKLSALREQLHRVVAHDAPLVSCAIGHTRWATHGRPTENNAHPHSTGRVSVVHNGIIENYLELRRELEAAGAVFSSETDTEIAAHLLDRDLGREDSPLAALRRTCAAIRGSYSFVAIDAHHPDRLLVAKSATPLVIGVGEGENFVASDIPAILPHTRKIIMLEDGDLAEISAEGITIQHDGVVIKRPIESISWDPVTAQKGGFKHYMLKEIHDQVQVLADTFRGRVGEEPSQVILPEVKLTTAQVKSLKRVVLVACGTAWHAALLAKFYIEEYARIPCEVDYASEFRYRAPVLSDDTLCIAVSQSGETADTLAALEFASRSAHTLAICNVLGSSLVRKAQHVVFTQAGPEISVASTKAFTTQLVCLFLVANYLGRIRETLSSETLVANLRALHQLPRAVQEALRIEPRIEEIARKYSSARDFLFLGRGSCYPIALEGALKLKEISYIHAEGYPAGEMKHGPIALIDEHMPVVALVQQDPVLTEKMISNVKEVEARGGNIIVCTDVGLDSSVRGAFPDDTVSLPFVAPAFSPIILTIPMQLLAYYVATLNGTDVDLPRNLAKSVTVE